MRDTIDFLRRVAPKDSFFWFRDGRVITRTEGMLASAPSPALLLDGLDAPVEETLAALARFGTDPDLELAGEALVFSSPRLRVRVRVRRGEAPEVSPYEGSWHPCPEGLQAWLKLAAQFTSDQGDWSSCVHLVGQTKDASGKVTDEAHLNACSARAMIVIEAPELRVPSSLLPMPAVNFITSTREAPCDVGAVAGSALLFRWPGGEELRAQLFAGTSFPAGNVDRALAAAGTEVPVPVTDELRAAFADISALSDGRVTLTADELRSSRQEGEGAAELLHARVGLALEGLPPDHVSHWSARALGPVLACAERWNPEGYRLRRPCRFEGPGVYGVVMGVSG